MPPAKSDDAVDEPSYYADQYRAAQRSGIQGSGNALLDYAIERARTRLGSQKSFPKVGEVLEVGASSGEHLAFVDPESFLTWTCLDLTPGVTDPVLFSELSRDSRVRFIRGDVEALPFPDGSFDEVVATCLLHHVTDPEKALGEMRRVVRTGGGIVLALPTDPGMLNRFVKVAITYRQMRNAGVRNPRLEYAREHRNHVGGLIEQVRHVFRGDHLQVRFLPLRLPSWNLNLFVVATVRRR